MTDLEDLFEDIAHEYIRVWNLMDVRPKQRVGIRYRFAEPTGVLWWSEGATIMFSDLLIRRDRIPGESRSSIETLQSLTTYSRGVGLCIRSFLKRQSVPPSRGKS